MYSALNALVDYLLQTSLVPLHLQYSDEESRSVHRWKQGKNSDFHEVHLLVCECSEEKEKQNDQNECVFKGCYVYGYRNLQTIIQKIKVWSYWCSFE